MHDKSVILEHISKSVRRRIEDGGYRTIEQFCHEHEFVKSTIYRVVNGEMTPKLETLIDIASALEIPLQDLMDLDKINPKSIARKSASKS